MWRIQRFLLPRSTAVHYLVHCIRLQLEALEPSSFVKLSKIATYERLRHYVEALVYDGREFESNLADYTLEKWLDNDAVRGIYTLFEETRVPSSIFTRVTAGVFRGIPCLLVQPNVRLRGRQ